MYIERMKELMPSLKLDESVSTFAENITDRDVLESRIIPDDLFSLDTDLARLTCMKIVCRLYDMSKKYTVLVGSVVTVTNHSCFTELPICRNSKYELMEYGRLELKDLHTIAMVRNMYDVIAALYMIHKLSTIKYVGKVEDVTC